jgi:hypothetical protein
MKESHYLSKKKIPLGLKIISIFYYVSAVLLLVLAIVSLFKTSSLFSVLGDGIGPIISLGFFVLAFLSFFIGRGIYKAQKWSRITAISLAILAILSAISLFIRGETTTEYLNGIINLVVNGFIGGYLLFNKKVKKYF